MRLMAWKAVHNSTADSATMPGTESHGEGGGLMPAFLKRVTMIHYLEALCPVPVCRADRSHFWRTPIGVLARNVKKELAHGLDLRNGCGHPSPLHPKDRVVAAHIETLIDYVYSQF